MATASARSSLGKETMFEEAARVPWLIRLPGQTAQDDFASSKPHRFRTDTADLSGNQIIPNVPAKVCCR